MSGPKWYGDTNETPKVDPERQKRLDMFACAALTGILADGSQLSFYSDAEEAYKLADAMEAERERRMKEEGRV